jgi:hypothetical protein
MPSLIERPSTYLCLPVVRRVGSLKYFMRGLESRGLSS